MNHRGYWSCRVIAGLVISAAGVAVIAAEATSGPPAPTTTFDLFTENEAATWNAAQPREAQDFRTRDLREDNGAPNCHSPADTDADNPHIRILAPALGRPLTAPLDIDLQFVPTSSAPIRPDTFRVCYVGLVTMDITKRITDRVPVSEKGLHVTGAQVPRGRHHLLLLIADQRGRLGKVDAVFDID